MFNAIVRNRSVSRVLRRGALSFPPSARRYRNRIVREIQGLQDLTGSATERLVSLESRWCFQTTALSRQGICFVNEARHILNAIERRMQKLHMLLEMGAEEQLAQAVELLYCPVPITPAPVFKGSELPRDNSQNIVHVHATELPAVINIIVSYLERETDQMERDRSTSMFTDPSRRRQGGSPPDYIALREAP